MISIGIIGAGGIAHAHAGAIRALADRCRLDAVYDPNPTALAAFCEQFADLGAHPAASADELFARPLDALIICTPNHVHSLYVRRAVERKLAVLCEKPAANTLHAAHDMAQAAALAGVVTMVGFTNRYQPGIRKLRHAMDAGLLGTIFAYRELSSGARLTNPSIGLEWRMRDWDAGGGAVADFGVHSLDMATWLLGDSCGPLHSLTGMLATFVKRAGNYPQNDDLSVVTGRFASGAIVSLMDSRVGPGLYQVDVMGSLGHAHFDLRKNSELDIHLYQSPGKPPALPDVTIVNPFEAQLVTFLDAIAGGRPVEPDLIRAYEIQRLIERVRNHAV